MKKRTAQGPDGGTNALRTAAIVTSAMLAIFVCCRQARGATAYWDADGAIAGNDAATGANLGGAGLWNTADARWWNVAAGVDRVWAAGDNAVFWGTAGAITASAVSANSLMFRTTGFSVNSGTVTMIGAASFNVDSGVTATISATLAGSATMAKLGTGTLILSNPANTNTATTSAGGWRLEGGGILRLAADRSLGASLPDSARNTITDIQLNQSTIQAGASFELDINRRTKINTNSATNLGDGIIDTHGHVLTWYGSIQGGPGSLRVTNTGGAPGLLILGTDDKASVNPFGSSLPAGNVNLTVDGGAIVQTSGTVTPTNGELGSETGAGGAVLAIKLDDGQIRSESGGYFFQRNLILGAGGGSLDVGAWEQTFTGTVSGPGRLSKEGTGILTLDNSSATWTGGTRIRAGTLQLGRRGSYGLLPGTLAVPSSITISSGAVLKFNRGSDKSFFDIISGAGGVTVANSTTAIVRLVANHTYTGPTTIASGILMIGQGNTGEPGSIASPVVNNSGALIFNRVEDLTYAGSISGPGTVEKHKGGRLVFTGSHTYSGSTKVVAGTLLIDGTLGSSAVTVLGGSLGGRGVINAPVTIQAAGRLEPGSSTGPLTINNALTLAGTTVIKLDAAAAGVGGLVRGLTNVTYGGTLSLSNIADALATSHAFKLFNATSYAGAFTSISPATPGPGLAWNTSTLATDGTLRVSLAPPLLSIERTPQCAPIPLSDCLTLSWPADYIGWRLQGQTNSLSTNWQEVPNSHLTNQMILPFDPAAGSVFYRLVYP